MKAVPPLVKNLIQANDHFDKTGVGPVSKNSLPLYVGRYVDPLTGDVRTFPKPSSKYVNPRKIEQVVSYYQARVLAAWNSFVRSEQNLMSLYKKYSSGAWNRQLVKK